ncbi:LOW QUALITY PROTEIN: septin-10-like [Rhynchonycteris naso]
MTDERASAMSGSMTNAEVSGALQSQTVSGTCDQVLQSYLPVGLGRRNVTLLGDRVFVEVISLDFQSACEPPLAIATSRPLDKKCSPVYLHVLSLTSPVFSTHPRLHCLTPEPSCELQKEPRPSHVTEAARAVTAEQAWHLLFQSHMTSKFCLSSQVTDDEQRKRENVCSLRTSGYIEFESLPDQLVNRSIQQGFFCFNTLYVGETGNGKSTLTDTLFNTNFEDCPSPHFYPNVRLKAQTYELQESNVRLKLTIVSTVGFADQINNEESYQPIIDYLDAQFEAYLQEELKIHRSLFNYHDSRIHACLYFISQTGHLLKTLDLLTMKSLHSKVNIIPVIAKADTISKCELQKFKIKLMSELVNSGVQIYQFPTDDDIVAEINASMNGHLPFAIVGSRDEVKVGNKMVKGRQYAWGVVEVENESHCDVIKLREMLISTNTEDLREQTHSRHYELYRRCRLEEMGFTDVGPDNRPLSLQGTYEAKRHEFYEERLRKEEEMKQMFVQRMKEKEAVLKEAERELQAKFEHLRRVHDEETMKLEEKRRLLEEEMVSFSKRKASSEIYQYATFMTVGSNLNKDKERNTPILSKTKVLDYRRSSQAKVIKMLEVCCDFLAVFICCCPYSVCGQ